MTLLSVRTVKLLCVLSTLLQTMGCGGSAPSANGSKASNAVESAGSNQPAQTPVAVVITPASPEPAIPPSVAQSGPDPVAAAPSATANEKRVSIRKWAACDGLLDDSQGVARAFDAAKNGAFTLIVDCPVRIDLGIDISKTIFIDNDTEIEFTSTGIFKINNVLHPAFVIANSKSITLTNWKIEWDASMPVQEQVNGYEDAGRFVATKKSFSPAVAFSDLRLTQWLNTNRGIAFDGVDGPVTSVWVGPTNTSSVFFLTGNAANLRIKGLKMYVPLTSGGHRFIPMAFSFSVNYKSNQTVSRKTPRTGQFMAVPNDIIFSDIELDGTYMGWQGNVQNVVFERIRSTRYGDLQDAYGGNVGGKGKWFAPPHLFYLNYDSAGDPSLFTKGVKIRDVTDEGVRVGVARDKGGSDTISGFATSLKIGCLNCQVTGYKSNRPDGFIDVLPSQNLTVSNAEANYDSSFLNNLFPGWRFPGSSYTNVSFENIHLVDLASASVQPPIAGTYQSANSRIVLKKVTSSINTWSGDGSIVPAIFGQGNEVAVNYKVQRDNLRVIGNRKGTAELTFEASPEKVRAGVPFTLSWMSSGAATCSAYGSWAGAMTTSGSRTMKVDAIGTHDFSLICKNVVDTTQADLRIEVTP